MNAALSTAATRYPYEDSAEYAELLNILETGWCQRTPEKRAAAAKMGWLRRRGLVGPEPWKAFRDALKAADPRLVRLYCCDVAESVQHYFQERYPGDTRTLDVIAAARRYANGEIGDQDRRRALKPIAKLLDERADSRIVRNDPADCALQAAAFSTAKRLQWVVEWTIDWAEEADNPRRAQHLDFAHYAQIFATFARTAA